MYAYPLLLIVSDYPYTKEKLRIMSITKNNLRRPLLGMSVLIVSSFFYVTSPPSLETVDKVQIL